MEKRLLFIYKKRLRVFLREKKNAFDTVLMKSTVENKELR